MLSDYLDLFTSYLGISLIPFLLIIIIFILIIKGVKK